MGNAERAATNPKPRARLMSLIWPSRLDADALSILANVAAIAGIPMAALALAFTGWQIREQRHLSRQQKSVDIFLECINTFGALMRDRADIENDDNLTHQIRRAHQHVTALWDLYATEFEYAVARLLPGELFERWFKLLLTDLTSNPPAWDVGGITPESAWSRSAEQVELISPAFAKLVRKALEDPPKDDKALSRLVRSYIRQGERGSVFRAI